MVQLLLAASKKKSYLSTAAYPILLDFVTSVSIQCSWKNNIHSDVYMYLYYRN